MVYPILRVAPWADVEKRATPSGSEIGSLPRRVATNSLRLLDEVVVPKTSKWWIVVSVSPLD